MSWKGHIGVLDSEDMDHFAKIFIAFQKRGKAEDDKGLPGTLANLCLLTYRLQRLQN